MLVPCGLSVLSYGSGGRPPWLRVHPAPVAQSRWPAHRERTPVTIDISDVGAGGSDYAWNVHVRWDPSILSYESIASQANICGALADSDGGGAILGCSIPEAAGIRCGDVGDADVEGIGRGMFRRASRHV